MKTMNVWHIAYGRIVLDEEVVIDKHDRRKKTVIL